MATAAQSEIHFKVMIVLVPCLTYIGSKWGLHICRVFSVNAAVIGTINPNHFVEFVKVTLQWALIQLNF